jgi:hypothetical protein
MLFTHNRALQAPFTAADARMTFINMIISKFNGVFRIFS